MTWLKPKLLDFMKILQLIASCDPAHGGPIETLKQQARALGEMGHSVEVVSLDDPNSPWLKDFPLPYTALGPSVSRYRFNKKLVPWLDQHASRFDAVIVRGLWRYTTFGTWRSLRKTGQPYFVFVHGMLDPWFKNYPLKYFYKYICWLLVEYRVLRDAKAVLFTSQEECKLARNSFSPYRCNEKVLRYGTAAAPENIEKYRDKLLSRFPLLNNKRILLFLGRIHQKKGCDLLLRAFAEHAQNDSNLHLAIAGPDEEGLLQKLQSLANDLKISDRITWCGMLHGEEKWGAFASAEAFILPSHQENFGIAVAEAMATSTPVLISNKVNIWREIANSNAGLVADDTIRGTSDLISNWLAKSEEQRQLMGRAALECFEENFEICSAAEHLAEFIRS